MHWGGGTFRCWWETAKCARIRRFFYLFFANKCNNAAEEMKRNHAFTCNTACQDFLLNVFFLLFCLHCSAGDSFMLRSMWQAAEEETCSRQQEISTSGLEVKYSVIVPGCSTSSTACTRMQRMKTCPLTRFSAINNWIN